MLTTGNQFRPAPPPAPGTEAFNKALRQVSEIGSSASATRTTEQTHIAQFYKQDAELTVNEAARELTAAMHHPLKKLHWYFC